MFITSTYLGDAIISSGILEALRKQNPEAKFTVACGPVAAPLFEAMPQLERLIPIQKMSYSRHWIKLWGQCFFKKWDLVVDVRGTGLSHFLFAKKRRIWGSSNSKELRVHQLAKFMGFKETTPSKLHVGPAHQRAADDLVKGEIICLSPVASWDKKCWPLDHFAKLAHELLTSKTFSSKARVAILGAPFQRKELEPLFQALPKDTVDLVGTVPLPVLAGVLEKSSLFVGNDSGLMHLAAAMGTPTVGLFGPSPENIYAPWGKKTTYVRTKQSFEEAMTLAEQGKNIMGDMTVEEVLEHIKDFI